MDSKEVIRLLHQDLAEKVVKEVRKLIGEEIIVVNTDGQIIASTNLERTGTFHEGALLASQQRKRRIITKQDERKLAGVKAGINLPIFFQKEVIGVIGITGEPEIVTPFGEIIRKMTELLIRENYYAEQFDWQTRAMETFVIEWLQANEHSPALVNQAKMLAVDLERLRTAVIIELAQIDQPLSRDVWSAIFNFFSNQPNDVAARSGNDRIILLIDGSNAKTPTEIYGRLEQFLHFLKNSFGLSAYAGVGQTAATDAIRDSFAQAERALKRAKRTGNISFDEELTLEMISGELSEKVKAEFVERTLGSILAEEELLQTLRELFKQNHSLKNTAHTLHIHINTLHYRLKRVEELTKLNPGNIHELLCLYLAILFLDEEFG